MLVQRWEILRYYLENHGNVAECVGEQAKLSHLGHTKPARVTVGWGF